MVFGDQNLLEQVVRNLEINAAQATEPGKKISVGTMLSNDNSFVEMYFNDTGQGIPEHLEDKIFEPFFTTKSEGKGTGPGLPIVKQIIEQHRGTLQMDSQVDVGTRIMVGIPIAQ